MCLTPSSTSSFLNCWASMDSTGGWRASTSCEHSSSACLYSPLHKRAWMVWRRRVEVVGREGGRACVWEEERRGTISTHTILRRSTGVGHLGTTLNSPGNICEQASSSFEPGNKTNTSPVASPLTLHTSTSHTKHITSSLTPHTTHFHLSHQTHHQ